MIDYDRLTLGGGASYYVSFDNVAVGSAIGEGLVKCMQDNGNDSGRRAAQRLADGQQRDAVQEGYEKAITSAGYEVTEVRACPTGTTRRPARSSSGNVREGQRQLRRRGRGQSPASAAQSPQYSARGLVGRHPDDRSGRDEQGPAARAARRAVHDRLQGDQEGGRRGRQPRDRARQGRQGRGRRSGDRRGHGHRDQQGREVRPARAAGDLPGEREGRHRRRFHHRREGLFERRAAEGLRKRTASADDDRRRGTAARAAAVPSGDQQELRRGPRPARRGLSTCARAR